MKYIRTLDDVTQCFLRYSPPDMKGRYQLGRMRQLMAYLGNPQEKYKIIHIAGTSGKTSTAYFVRGMLEASGQKTGLTVSPHVVAINERVQIGGCPLPEALFVAYVNEFLPLVAQTGLSPTYFELLVALAYWIFAQEAVDYAIVETGMGGLLDGTNVVQRLDKVCIITDIGLDHTEVLGDTLPQIAAQKAGIIKPGNHVLLRKQTEEVVNVIRRVARQQRATMTPVISTNAPQALPAFQHRNWAMARAAYGYLSRRDKLPLLARQHISTIASQTPPGRWEIYHYKNKTIILDGAHNPQKLQALCQSLQAAGYGQVAVLAGFVESPETKLIGALAALQPIASHVIVTEFRTGQDVKSRRSFTARYVQQLARAQAFQAVETQPEAMLPCVAYSSVLNKHF